jgi:membrane protease YdiL (CAAX protease family)
VIADSHHAPVSEYHVPTGLSEISLRILLLLSAGSSEELVFRGFLQRPFHAATGCVRAAVVPKGLVFGLGHTDQGWDQAIVISVLGMLYRVFVV